MNGSVVLAGYTEEFDDEVFDVGNQSDTQPAYFVAFKLDSGGNELWRWQVAASCFAQI